MSEQASIFAPMRYFLRIRYKGTAYHGWQIQQNAHSVQAEVNLALSRILRQDVDTVGCGRTDTGVHADDFYLHFDIETPITDTKRVLNRLDTMKISGIQFRELFEVSDNAHARFDATERAYEYRILRERNPFWDGLGHYFFGELDIAAMNTAATMLLGKKDFVAFSKAHTQVFTNICTVRHAAWTEQNGQLIFTIRANRFLRNMVRAIVGTLLEIGQGKRSVDSIPEILAKGNRSDAGMSVPAYGLFLTEVIYPEPILSHSRQNKTEGK
jgi:tRNA pseudouridine38-40 synthase